MRTGLTNALDKLCCRLGEGSMRISIAPIPSWTGGPTKSAQRRSRDPGRPHQDPHAGNATNVSVVIGVAELTLYLTIEAHRPGRCRKHHPPAGCAGMREAAGPSWAAAIAIVGKRGHDHFRANSTPREERRMSDKIRVALADDHPIVLAGLRNLIETEADLELVGEANSGQSALKLIRDRHTHMSRSSTYRCRR